MLFSRFRLFASCGSLAGLGLLVLTACSPEPPPLAVSLGETRAISPDFVGFNGNLTQFDAPWSQENLVTAFKQMHPGSLRYPAGTIGNYWDWDKGWIADDVPDHLMIPWVVEQNLPQSPKRYTLENLADMYHATSVDVVFMLNMLTRDLDHSLRNLRRARDLGIPIKYIELGNEFYFNLPLETQVYPTPEDYGKACAIWMAALKPEFPEAQFAVVAGGPRRSERHHNWDERVLAHATGADAITIHTYTSTGLAGLEGEEIAGQEAVTETDTLRTPEARQQAILDRLNTPTGYADLIATAHSAARRWEGHPMPEGGEIWMTEWNLRGDDDPIRGTWANTLFISVFYHTFLESGVVNLSHYHNLIGTLFPAVFTNETGYAHVQIKDVPTRPWAMTAGGLASALFGEAMTNRTAATPLRFAEIPPLMHAGQTLPRLVGWHFAGREQPASVLLVNFGSTPQRLDLAALNLQAATFQQFHAALDTYVIGTDNLSTQTGTLGPSLTLPPYSITVAHSGR